MKACKRVVCVCFFQRVDSTFWSNRHPIPAQIIASARMTPMVANTGVADCTSLQVSVNTSLQIEMNSPGVSRNVDAKST